MDIQFGELPPKRGHFLLTVNSRTGKHGIYRILKSRLVKRRDRNALPRYTMIVRKLPTIPAHKKPIIFQLSSYPRRRVITQSLVVPPTKKQHR